MVRTSDFQSGSRGSIPRRATNFFQQLGEQKMYEDLEVHVRLAAAFVAGSMIAGTLFGNPPGRYLNVDTEQLVNLLLVSYNHNDPDQMIWELTVPNEVRFVNEDDERIFRNDETVIITLDAPIEENHEKIQIYSETPGEYSISLENVTLIRNATGTAPDRMIVSLRQFSVPNLLLKHIDEVEDILLESNLVLGRQDEEYFLDTDVGIVMGQYPMPGTKVEKDSEVIVVVSLGPPPQPLPDFVGFNLSDALIDLDILELVVGIVDYVFDEEVSENIIVSQYPSPEGPIFPGDTIDFVVSKGKEPFITPNFIGLTLEDIQSDVDELDLDVTVSYEHDFEFPEHQIIFHSPEGNVEIFRGDPMEIIVSLGLPFVTVPDLTGITVSSANSTLVDVGLELGSTTEEYNDNYNQGLIVSHTPTVNTDIRYGSTVDVVVSLGSEPEPEVPLININTASTQVLQTLPRIDGWKAQAIFNNRPYSAIEEIIGVRFWFWSVSQTDFNAIKDLITVN